jgi:hypothetical protein
VGYKTAMSFSVRNPWSVALRGRRGCGSGGAGTGRKAGCEMSLYIAYRTSTLCSLTGVT